MHDPVCESDHALQAATAKPRFSRSPEPNGTVPALRNFDLGGAKPVLPRERSGSCSLLNQEAFRLEKEFEVDHGFHRTPLVPGCLEALQ